MTVIAERRRIVLALGLPGLVFCTVFLLAPMFYAARLAVRGKDGGVTVAHFATILNDSYFHTALLNTIIIPAASVMVELAAGLGIALLLTQRFRGRGAMRAVAILPFAVPEIVFLLIMKYIFTEHGYINGVLHAAGADPVRWLEPGTWLALSAVVLADAWHVTPIVFLMLLAALESIPSELHEAAATDGASVWQRFRYVTWPLVLPALAAAVVLRAVDAMRIFATPLVLTGVDGVPVLSTYAYHQWTEYSAPGPANAAGVVLGVVVLASSYLYLKFWKTAEGIDA